MQKNELFIWLAFWVSMVGFALAAKLTGQTVIANTVLCSGVTFLAGIFVGRLMNRTRRQPERVSKIKQSHNYL
jgi:hypothetical protein